MNTLITSLYWNEIPSEVAEKQKKVFDKFGYDIVQTKANIRHPDYMDWVMNNTSYDRYLFVDIDCIPLSRGVIEEALDKASGTTKLFGCAQASNHLAPEFNKNIYAAAFFILLTQDTYTKLGRPSFRETYRSDVAAELTWNAREREIPVELWYPKRSKREMIWNLGDWGKYGEGSFYGPEGTDEEKIFHLFQIRVSIERGTLGDFLDECDRVINS
jgi:hypothetical protein